MNEKKHARVRDWYSVSVATVRRWVMLGALAVAVAGGVFGYQQWERYTLQQEAFRTIEEAGGLIRQLERRDDYEQLRGEHGAAWDLLRGARDAYAAATYDTALEDGRRSLLILHSILHIGERPGEGEIRFLSVQGGVEYRRGERGAWTRGRTKVSLSPGDWVKTGGDGIAEIVFPDGTLYTLRENTMVHLATLRSSGSGRGEDQVTDVRFGWVELNTSQSGSTVTTPQSEARVSRDSEALVAYDRERARGRFAAFEGAVRVRSSSGQVQELGRLQEVEQVGELLSEARPLPPAPRLVSPPDDQEIDFDHDKQLRLSWQAVREATKYALNVGRNRLFAANVVEDGNRAKTSATLGIRGEGSFYWRVASIDRAGRRGPWSEPRSFRVASLRGARPLEDKTPPDLEVQEVQTYGSLVIVNGRSEPGATVTINGEPTSVQLDGTFSKTIQMTQDGWGFVEVVATDAWGNSSEKRERVFIDVF